MTKSYKKYPIPLEAWTNFKKKQAKMNETLRLKTGTKVTVPLSKVILASSINPLWFNDDEIRRLVGRKVNKHDFE